MDAAKEKYILQVLFEDSYSKKIITNIGVTTINSCERIMAAAKHLPTDCVPVAPSVGNHGAITGGARISDYCTNGKIMAEAQLRACLTWPTPAPTWSKSTTRSA